MEATRNQRKRLPPRWFIRVAWAIHRAIHRLTGGRRGLWLVRPGRWGTMRITTVGRRSGKKRSAILGYYEDGPNLVTMAMNGWGAPEPAWWLNLQAQPDAEVELKTGTRAVRARADHRSDLGRRRGARNVWARARDDRGRWSLMPCTLLAALIVACIGHVPDTAKRVTVPRECVKKFSAANQAKAKACARENKVKWRISGKRKRV